MRKVTLVLVALAGCASKPTVGQSLRSAEISLKGVDVRLRQDADEWSELAAAAMARCESASVGASRERCLGAIAESGRATELADAIRASYDLIAEELEKAKAAAKDLEALHDQAKKEAADG